MALVDYFLKIDGIDGESHDSKHKGDIDLESWGWGAAPTAAAAAAAPARSPCRTSTSS
jgi:type VI secretion system secreted protein Hcp